MKKEKYQKEGLDEHGREIPDPIPMAPPVGFHREPTMAERVREMVRSEHMRLAAEAQGLETFEESDDFETGEDDDLSSPYEEHFDPIEEDVRLRLRQASYRAEYAKRVAELPEEQRKVLYGDTENGRGFEQGGKTPDRGRSEDNDREQQSGERKEPSSAVQGGLREGERNAPRAGEED